MSGFVYAITDEHDRVKLGWSANPSSRFVKIQADNGANCRLVGVIPASLEQEAALHELLAPWRVSGEWFRASAKPVAHFISCVTPVANKMKIFGGDRHQLAKYRSASGLSLEAMARACKSTRATLSRVERHIQKPSMSLIERIHKATNGAVTPNDFMNKPTRGAQ